MDELKQRIEKEIDFINNKIGGTFSDDQSDAINRVAKSNCYLALVQLETSNKPQYPK